MFSFLPMEHCSLIQCDFLQGKGNTSEREGGTKDSGIDGTHRGVPSQEHLDRKKSFVHKDTEIHN